MRRILQAIVTALSVFLAAGSAQAALIDRGGGLIYDTTLNITWLQNANAAAGSVYDDGWSPTDGRMSFANAKAWAANFSYLVPLNGITYSDWRLPQGYDIGAPGAPGFLDTPAPGQPGYAGPSGAGCDWQYSGYDCGWSMNPRSSELVHLYYVDMGNLPSFNTLKQQVPGVTGVDFGWVHNGPFINVDNYIYWSAIVNPVDPTQEWRHFKTSDGRLSWRLNEPSDYHAWAVADGDIATFVPEPETYAMLLAGLGLLGFVARRRKQQAA